MNHANLMRCDCPTYKKESVLTLDGGGIRGLVSLLILERILGFIRDEEWGCDRRMVDAGYRAPRTDGRDKTELPLACHYFSFMFGTSTGGIIAIMLGRLRMGIKDCIDTYCNLGREIFEKRQPFHFLGQNKYDCTKLERIINDVVQKHRGSTDAMIADPSVLNKAHPNKQDRAQNRCIPCRVGVFAVQSDPHSSMDEKLHLFRTYINDTPASAQELNDPTISLHRRNLQTPICKIARATSAAPTYFKSVEVDGLKLLDGGLLANNPSKFARAEVISMHRYHPSGSCKPSNGGTPKGGIRFLVSLGTGKQADQLITRGAGPVPKLLSIVRRALKKMTDPEPVHRDLQDALDPSVYYRFNVEEDLKKMKLDECIVKGEDNITFSRIEKAVRKYFNDGGVWDRAQYLAKQLVKHRRERRNPGHEWYRNLTIPGPPPSPMDDRYRGDETTNGAINEARRGSLPEPLFRAVEMPAQVPEMPTGLMIPELLPRSPLQDSTRSLPTSPTSKPYDSAMPRQGEWSTQNSRIWEYYHPPQERDRKGLGIQDFATRSDRESSSLPPSTPDTPS
ncbi:FabD/lysophospholipase-like protein, partial [Aureobasidium melanogenum]